eukprot:12105342-Alexandrium_andersonii.AAC.1
MRPRPLSLGSARLLHRRHPGGPRAVRSRAATVRFVSRLRRRGRSSAAGATTHRSASLRGDTVRR